MLGSLNRVLTNIETAFNIAECIPWGIGASAGGLRVEFGEIQGLTGLGVAAIGFVGQLVSDNKWKWKKVTNLGLEHARHGGRNMLRGFAAVILGMTPFGIGNLAFLIPNLRNPIPFSPIFKYRTFTRQYPPLKVVAY